MTPVCFAKTTVSKRANSVVGAFVVHGEMVLFRDTTNLRFALRRKVGFLAYQDARLQNKLKVAPKRRLTDSETDENIEGCDPPCHRRLQKQMRLQFLQLQW